MDLEWLYSAVCINYCQPQLKIRKIFSYIIALHMLSQYSNDLIGKILINGKGIRLQNFFHQLIEKDDKNDSGYPRWRLKEYWCKKFHFPFWKLLSTWTKICLSRRWVCGVWAGNETKTRVSGCCNPIIDQIMSRVLCSTCAGVILSVIW